MKIEFLPHTADIEIKVVAESFSALFQGATLGMSRILKAGMCQGKAEYTLEQHIELQAVDTTCLLVDYLSDVLTLSYTEKAVFCAVNFHKLEETSLSARIYGRAVEGFDEEIKAVTYHGANVRQNQKKQWETCIIFDI